MAAATKPAKPAYELSGWERFKKMLSATSGCIF